MPTIIEYEVVTKITRDNQDHLPGTTISLEAKDASELFKVGAIKLPDDELQGANIVGAGHAGHVDQSEIVAQLQLAQLNVQSALVEKEAALVELQGVNEQLAASQAALQDAARVQGELTRTNEALSSQLALLQKQWDDAVAAADAAAAAGSASADAATGTSDQTSADATSGKSKDAAASSTKVSKSAKA